MYLSPAMNQEITARTFDFAVRIIKLCQVLEEKPGVSRTLANQLLRSGTSIGAIIFTTYLTLHNNNNKK